jgi:hypothetical protein
LWSDNKVQNYIIDLLTEGESTSQLYELGQDGNGVFIGEYSFNTIQYKISENQRYDHITFNDGGDYYETFIVTPLKTGFKTDDNPIKDGENIIDKINPSLEVTKLQEQNVERLVAFIEEDFNKKLEKRLFQ